MDKEFLDNLSELQTAYQEAAVEYEKECDEWWENLSEEDRLHAFYSVVKRIHKAELEDRGSYRWALYDVFGFGPEAYGIGMDCGYMAIHNSIYDGEDLIDGDVLRRFCEENFIDDADAKISEFLRGRYA